MQSSGSFLSVFRASSLWRLTSFYLVFSFLFSPVASAKEELCDILLKKLGEGILATRLLVEYQTPKVKASIQEAMDSAAGKKAKEAAAALATGAFHFLKGTKYPVFAITDSLKEFLAPGSKRDIGTAKEILKNRWEKDRFHLGTYASLALLNALTGISLNAFHKATSSFDEEDGEDGLTVVIDNMDEDSKYPDLGTYIFGTRYKGKKNVVLLKDISLAQELPLKLKELVAQYKLPINKIDIYADGLPGIVKHPYSNSSITDAAWDSQSFPGKPIDEKSNPSTPTGFWQGALYEAKIDDGIIAPGAKIRINSSYVGRGKEGELYQRALGNTYLRHGGKTYTSNVAVDPSVAEYISYKTSLPRPWRPIRTLSDWMFPELGLKTAFDLAKTKIQMGSKDTAPLFSLPNHRSREIDFQEESDLKKQFESRWSEKLKDLSQPYHEIQDYDDLEHYTKVDPKLSEATALGAKKSQASMDSKTETITLSKNFDNAAQAKEYFSLLTVDKDLMLPPSLNGTTITMKSKPRVYEKLRDREAKERAHFADETAQSLKSLYDEKLSYIEAAVKAGTKPSLDAKKEKEQLYEIYHHYSALTGVYHYPWWGRNWLE